VSKLTGFCSIGGKRGTGDVDGTELGFFCSGLCFVSTGGAESTFEWRGGGSGGVGVFSIGFSFRGGGEGVCLPLISFFGGVAGGVGVFCFGGVCVRGWTFSGDGDRVFFGEFCLTGVGCLFGLGDFCLTGVGCLFGLGGFLADCFFGGGVGERYRSERILKYIS